MDDSKSKPDAALPPLTEGGKEILRLKSEAVEVTGRGIIITDRQGAMLWANKAMHQLTGYSPEEIIGKNPQMFQSGRQPASFYKQLWETILAGKEWHGEIVNRRKDGSLYVEQLAITPVRDAGGEVAHFIAVKQDVTAERQALERARLLALVVENSSEMIATTDMNACLTYVNPALARILARTEQEIIGKPFSIMLSRTNPAPLIEEIAQKSYESSGWSGECLLAGRDREDIPVEVRTSQIRDDQGRVVGSLGIAHDIRERKKNELRLRESEEMFRQLAENIHEVFFVFTLEPVRVIYVSPAYQEIWGRKVEDVYERPTAWIEAIHPEDRQRALDIFRKEQRGAKTDMEYRVVRPDGSIRWIRNRTYPVLDDQGRFSRVVGFAEDITESKNAEADLRKAHEKLNDALEEARRKALTNEKLTELIDLVQCCQTDEQAYKIVEDALASIFESCNGALCLTSPSRDIVEAVALWGEDAKTESAFSPADCWALRRGKIHMVRDGHSPLRCAHVHATLQNGHMCVPLMAQGETLGLLYLECKAHEAKPDGPSKEELATGVMRQAELVGERVSLVLANLKLREILRHQSVRDPLTSLFNRRYMEETLDREVSRAARRNEGVAVVMCDLDRFKEFNDTFGHEAGDLVLREVASILRLKVRQGDIACRFGGEEFILILPDATDVIAAERTDAIRREVEDLALSYRGRTLGQITISMGIAIFPDDGATADELVRASDKALYQAKTQGRDRVVFSLRNL